MSSFLDWFCGLHKNMVWIGEVVSQRNMIMVEKTSEHG